MAQWSPSLSHQFNAQPKSLVTATEREICHSTTSTSTTRRLRDRPPSLLPPPPQLERPHSSDTIKVECRLSSGAASEVVAPSTPVDRTSTTKVQDLSDRLREASVSNDDLTGSRSLSTTPVSSLPTSNYSRSSLNGTDHSPCKTISPLRRPLEPPLPFYASRSMVTTREVLANIQVTPHVTSISSPLSSPTMFQDAKTGIVSLPADPARNSSYLPHRPVPDSHVNTAVLHLPQSSQDSGETSYFDWDDDGEKGPSALSRMKKSFTDLRAAERSISDASNRRKGQIVGPPLEYETLTALPSLKDSNKAPLLPSSPHESAVEVQLNTPVTKLRRLASTKRVAKSPSKKPQEPALPFHRSTAEFAQLHYDTVPTLSKGKRKRADTASSQSSDASQTSQRTAKMKTKGSAVSGLFRKLLGVKRAAE
jgi:hypothetical protein